ncbi:MAG TPA: sugar porter family MFS transporter [Vicinamibacteria bacterium]|nr:sugar porter family MFS transporter [Vicinamibacteria bacterium]
MSSRYATLIAAVAAVSGLLFGFDTAVINGALIFLRQELALSTRETEVATSSLLVGCAVGAAVAGWLTDRLGRKRILLASALLFAASAVGAALPRHLAEFAAARLLGGLAIGVASVLAPLYIAEISPRRVRGRLVSLNQMAIVTGILLAYFAGWLLSFAGPSSWRWMFASAAVPSCAFFFALLFVPESPRFLVEAGREAEALAVLERVGGGEQARIDVAEIRDTIAAESGTLRELFAKRLRKPLGIAVFLAVFQQITGINTVIYYGSLIFKEQVGGQSDASAIGANVVIGAVNFLMTIVALGTIDRLGRRPLMMLASGGMATSLLALGLLFRIEPRPAVLVLLVILLYVASFGVGLGPGVWVVISELFPTRIRGRAMSIATVSLWLACILVTATFLSLVEAVGSTGAFWLYAAMSVLNFVFVWRFVPETKGRSLEEIERSW